MSRPIIGITSPSTWGNIQVWAIQLNLLLAGGKSKVLSPAGESRVDELDGVILSGGTDVFPELFASDDIKPNYRYNTVRDQFEKKVLKVAIRKNLPTLCICRGAQLLNIVRGGSLYTNVAKVFEGAEYPSNLLGKIFYRKPIRIKSGSLLSEAFQRREAEVNSLHGQSIAEVGRGLEITSTEPNGIVQSVEGRKNRFLLGVQFHPEFLTMQTGIRRLFGALVDEARAYHTQPTEEGSNEESLSKNA